LSGCDESDEPGLEATRKVAGVGQGRLRIGTLYSLTLETVPRIIMGMKLRRPELELDLTMGSNQMLLDMLEDDALDAILIATNEGEFNNTAFDVVPLFEDDIFSPPRRRNSWMPHNSPTCAITPIASLSRWRRVRHLCRISGSIPYRRFRAGDRHPGE
jgi:DNA-binding transcriptional LysR family regulator